eukprot:150375-Amphidinium_carterae.1
MRRPCSADNPFTEVWKLLEGEGEVFSCEVAADIKKGNGSSRCQIRVFVQEQIVFRLCSPQNPTMDTSASQGPIAHTKLSLCDTLPEPTT